MHEADGGRTVAARVLSLLDAFTGDRDELTLSELSRRTGLPVSTAHRLAKELVTWGGLERSASGGYLVGVRLWEVATRSPHSSGLRAAAMPFMGDLYEATREHVQLAVLDHDDALVVEKISGRAAVETVSRVGGRLPLHASGVGKVILAYADRGTQSRILTGSLDRFTDRTCVSTSELRRILARVRQQGYATSREELSLGADSTAAPVLGPDRSCVAAISIVIPAGTSRLRELTPAVRTAAIGISRALGAPHR